MTDAGEPELDPSVRRWLKRIAEFQTSPGEEMNIDESRRRARAIADRIAEDFTDDSPAPTAVDEFLIGRAASPLRVRRYRPRSATPAAPTQLWLHGGGFVSGTVDEKVNEWTLAQRAAASGVQILALEYRLAPEHPYPAAVHDTLRAFDAVLQDPERFGADPARLGIGGNSAGGAIAASAALLARDRGLPIHHQSLEVPAVALRPVGRSARRYAMGFGVDDAPELVAGYLGPGGAADEYAAALDAPEIAGVAPALVMVAEFDPLRDAGIRYARRLTDAGVPTVLVIGTGHLHGTPGLTGVFPSARDWQRRHADELARAYNTRC